LGLNSSQALYTSVINFLYYSMAGTTLEAILSLVMMIITYLLAARFIDRRSLSDFGFHLNRTWFKLFGIGLALGAGLMLFIFITEYTAGWIIIKGFIQTNTPWNFIGEILLAIILFICVGFYEEMLARGYQLHNLAEGFNFGRIHPKVALVIGYLISSMIFGFMHAGNPNASLVSTINLFMAGLFLGLGYILTGELALPIGLHITWNFFEGNVFGFPVSGTNAGVSLITIQQNGPSLWTGGAFGPEAGLIGIVAIILGSLLIFWLVRKVAGQITLASKLAIYSPILRKELESKNLNNSIN
jgi:uncharacterized protein